MGWNVRVVTAAEDAVPPFAQRNHFELIRIPFRDPYQSLRFWLTRDEDLHSGFLDTGRPKIVQKCLRFVRANYFVPDPKVRWAKRVIRYLKADLRDKPVDLVVSTGPPHSTHMIAAFVKRMYMVKWIADYRDLWTESETFHLMPMSKRVARRHRQMEKVVLDQADQILTVSQRWKDHLQEKTDQPVVAIFSGVEPCQDHKVTLTEKFTMAYFGYMAAGRNPEKLWQALGLAITEIPSLADDLEIHLYGAIDGSVKRAIKAAELEALVTHYPYEQHTDAQQLMRNKQVLILTLSRDSIEAGHIPMKTYDYLSAGRPILGLGDPDGDCSRLLKMHHGQALIGHDDEDGLCHAIKRFYAAYRHAGAVSAPNYEVAGISVESQSKKLAHLFDQTISPS